MRGSKPNRGAPATNCSSASRRRIRASTRTGSCARLQRRVKVWRREKATAMVFGELPAAESVADAE